MICRCGLRDCRHVHVDRRVDQAWMREPRNLPPDRLGLDLVACGLGALALVTAWAIGLMVAGVPQ